MTTLNLAIPKSDTRVSVDTSKFPQNVVDRLIEIGLTAHVRSSVNSAYSTEIEKAMREDEKDARETFEAAEKAALAANAKYKVKTFKSKFDDKKVAKAFVEAFTTAVDPVAVANERIAEMLEGKIRAARGESGSNKALSSLVKANILAVLKSKGKKHRDALAMIGEDPFAFIDKTARKRAGDDADAYKTELAKLNAQYVEPAKLMLADDPEEADGEDSGEDTDTDANDLI
jgi:hypothetical protein